ncbi:MAG: RNA polymerase sigma factor (sigma-70 family) [Saprospiraceae bacterium]|jgi:RNA polymerase sigma factor (sigma-70 family)
MVVPGPNLSAKALYDYRLVRDAIDNKSQKAYAELLERYRDSIFYMLLKMVGNKDDADDLTIEAFGKAFKKLEQYTPNYAFSTWLFKIASNNCIDFIRKRKKNTFSMNRTIENEEGGDLELDIPSDELNPEQVFMKLQKVEMMHNIVDQLKPRYKDLVQLRYFKEFSYEEIAVELNIPIGTVKAQLFRAREFLFQIMEKTKKNI